MMQMLYRLLSQILASKDFNNNQTLVPFIGEQHNNEMLFGQFSNITISIMDFVTIINQHFNASLFCNPGDKVLKKLENYGTNLSPSFNNSPDLVPWIGNNNTLQCLSGIFPTTLIYVVMLENCQNSISIDGCSPIQGTRL